MNKKVGKLSAKVIDILKLDTDEMPIILGDANIQHMKNKHFEDYSKYGKYIEDIIKLPTYVAKNPNQGSIEYIKEFKVNNELVLVAVRLSHKGTWFEKTLFVMSERKKDIYLTRGYAKKYN